MILKKTFLLRTVAAVVAAGISLTFAACVSEKTDGKPRSGQLMKRKKVGFYVDNGSRGGGVIHLARLIAYSPQLELIPLEGQDLREGKLNGLDLLVIPGGSSELQYQSMEEAGAEAIRKFIAGGGSYFGVCAGCHCALNKPKRIGLLPYTYIEKGFGDQAPLGIRLNQKGAELLGIPAKRYTVQYSQGPISQKGPQPGTGWGEELAIYLSSVNRPESPQVNFVGRPAILHGRYGKGKVIATSFHPEAWPSTWPIALGCISAVTGVKPVPVLHAKKYRPIRVGYYAATIRGKRCINDALELDRNPEFDVNFTASLGSGILEHLDVMIIPDNRLDACKRALAVPFIRMFLDRGGKLIVSEAAAEFAPKHKNVVTYPAGRSLTDAVFAAVRK